MSDIIMTHGCTRCTKEFTMGTDTHNYKYKGKGKPMVGGTCPWCGYYNTWLMHATEISIYPPNEGIAVTEVPYHADI